MLNAARDNKGVNLLELNTDISLPPSIVHPRITVGNSLSAVGTDCNVVGYSLSAVEEPLKLRSVSPYAVSSPHLLNAW